MCENKNISRRVRFSPTSPQAGVSTSGGEAWRKTPVQHPVSLLLFWKWQNVKRSPLYGSSLHPNTVLMDFLAFSDDSQNATCRRMACLYSVVSDKISALYPLSVHNRIWLLLLLPSDLLTLLTFWRAKLQSFDFHFPKIWLPGTKQTCLGGETILFEASNYIVWLAKQYSFGRVLSIFWEWNV